MGIRHQSPGRSFAARLIVAGLFTVGCGSGPSASKVDPKAKKTKEPPSELPWGAKVLTEIKRPLGSIEIAGKCTLDAINRKKKGEGPTKIKVDQPLRLQGWLADDVRDVPKEALFVLQSDHETHAIKIDVTGERPDVAKALGESSLMNSGYILTLEDTPPPGLYRLGILFGGKDDTQACPLNHELSITE